MTNKHTSLEKYTSHTLFSKGLRKGWCWLCVRGIIGALLLDCSTGILRAQALCLALAFTTASCPQLRLELELWLQLKLNSACLKLQLTQTICGTWLYILWVSHLHRIQPVHRSRSYSDIFDWMHLFLDWRLGRRSICYIYNDADKMMQLNRFASRVLSSFALSTSFIVVNAFHRDVIFCEDFYIHVTAHIHCPFKVNVLFQLHNIVPWYIFRMCKSIIKGF